MMEARVVWGRGTERRRTPLPFPDLIFVSEDYLFPAVCFPLSAYGMKRILVCFFGSVHRTYTGAGIQTRIWWNINRFKVSRLLFRKYILACFAPQECHPPTRDSQDTSGCTDDVVCCRVRLVPDGAVGLPSVRSHLVECEGVIRGRRVAADERPLCAPGEVGVVLCHGHETLACGVPKVYSALLALYGAVEPDRIGPRHTCVVLKVVSNSCPELGAGIPTPSVRVSDNIVLPDLVIPQIVFGPAVDEKIGGDGDVGRSVVVVNRREEVSEVSVSSWSVHDKVVGYARPFWRGGGVPCAVVLDVRRPVPRVDRPVVLRLPHPVEEQVP
mmetsp:Transcript_3064/g.6335  ORF Transcript_3064/g.6335 Transcript_3064/m.6335 type:complete len:327 (-) Transcript_3064:276-1256(-)